MIRVTVADEVWTFDEESMRNVEAIALQKVTGLKWAELVGGLYVSDPTAITALVWLCKKRAGVADADNRYSALDFDLRDFDWDPLDEDGRVLRYRNGVIISRDGVPEPGWDEQGNPVEVAEEEAEDPTSLLPEPTEGS